MYASSRGGSMTAGTMAMAMFTGTVGYLIADGLDRFMATYNPSSTEAAPKDKFTSSGNGTLANTMNIAATPGWKRIAVGVAAPVVPAVGAVFVKNKMGRTALEGLALGAGISTLKMLFNTLVVGRLLKPKDVSAASLQKSIVARLYPAEVSARVNIEQKLLAVSSAGSGALSGARDPGPFAVADSPRYPDASQAARGVGDMPTASDVMRRGVGDMPTAADAIRQRAGVAEGWEPGPPPGPGPGPQNSNDASCGCADQYSSFLGDKPEETPFVR